MSEKERLLTSGTRDRSAMSLHQRVVKMVKKSEDTVKRLWGRSVQAIHGREFFAEFLATFVLIVSMCGVY